MSDPLQLQLAVKTLLPPQNISSMKKKDILKWVSDNKILERYRIFYQQGSEEGIKSSVTDISDSSNPIPSSLDFEKQRVGTIRKQITKWTRALGLRKMKSRRVKPQDLKEWASKSSLAQMLDLGGPGMSSLPEAVPTKPPADPSVSSMLQHLNTTIGLLIMMASII